MRVLCASGDYYSIAPLTLEVLQGEYAIYRLLPQTPLPPVIMQSSFLSVTRTEEELSVVCDSSLLLDAETSESGWSCIKVLGSLDFALTGILARLSTILAEAEISIFAVSTYDPKLYTRDHPSSTKH